MSLRIRKGLDINKEAGSPWWRDAIIYQIYPRSFADGNGDGDGDLLGLVDRLDHLAGDDHSLGVDAIWLTPTYPSPWRDGGYDVTEYTDIDPRFGRLADMERLIDEAHRRGLKVMLDWVPNHTSAEHRWFQDARSSRTSAYRDYYVWADGQIDSDGASSPPNNWLSAFDSVGPAWTHDAVTGQWYLHSFSPDQPDLNWDNPDVRAAMHDVLRFWAERGVDGFRIDVAQCLGKDPALGDNPFPIVKPTAAAAGLRHDEDWPSVHERLRELHDVVAQFGSILLVGEVYVLDPGRLAEYVTPNGGLDMAHNFALINAPHRADALRGAVEQFEAALDSAAWPAWFLNNHDHSRVATRWATDAISADGAARQAALLLLTLRGTPFLYQGEELGLIDTSIEPTRVIDLDGRDPVRTPMPWISTHTDPQAGFSAGDPWLPLPIEAAEGDVETQRLNPGSVLNWYRTLISLRRAHVALRAGEQTTYCATEEVWAYRRVADGDDLLIAINFADQASDFELRAGTARLLVSTEQRDADAKFRAGRVRLGPGEGAVFCLSPE